MNKTGIEWTEKTWSPVTGCTPISAGCANCYAARMAKRLAGRGGYPKHDPFAVTLHEDRLLEPLGMRKPSTIFVCSMGDLFHADVPFAFVDRVMATIALCPHHRFVVLTKRAERMREYMNRLGMPGQVLDAYEEILRTGGRNRSLVRAVNAAGKYNYQHGRPGFVEPWPLPNLILGVSVEDQAAANTRILSLMQTPAETRILSIEPMLGPINLARLEHKSGGAFINAFTGKAAVPGQVICAGAPIDGVIVGGESGPKARPMHPDWVRSIRDQCATAGVPFFFKQWGEWTAVEETGMPTMPAWTQESKRLQRTPWLYVSESGESGHVAKNGTTHMIRVGKKHAGRELDGRTHDDLPEAMRSNK